jgi:hypothetical protein
MENKLKAIILGTGPSLLSQADDIKRLQQAGFKVFGINNTFINFNLDYWIACDPSWHEIYSPVDFSKMNVETKPPCGQYHWDSFIAGKHGYIHIKGEWRDGLSTSWDCIHYGHSSGYQALNLAVLHGAKEIYLCGYDMNYKGLKRHYFDGLSEKDGEYPETLRKYSKFDGLIKCYETIANQEGLPPIYNCTKDSSLTCFPFRDIGDL